MYYFMNRKNVLLIALTIVVVIASISLVGINRNLRVKLRDSVNETSSIKVENILLKEGFFHSYDFEVLPFDDSRMVYDHQNNALPFSDVIGNETTLVLFANVNSCGACSASHIERIKALQSTTKLKVVLGIDGMDERSFRAYVLNNNLEAFAYRLSESFYSGFQHSPVFYFVADGLKRTCFYAPSDAFPSLTDVYYDKLNTMYGF